MKKNAGHELEWGKCVYLDREKNWRRRKIKESININAINPTESMVHQEIFNLEKVMFLTQYGVVLTKISGV